MIGWEALLLVSIAGIFIVLLRRLPAAIREARDDLPTASQPPQVSPTMRAKPAPASNKKSTESDSTSQIAVVSPAPPIVEQPADEIYTAQQADGLYKAGDYSAASLAYESLLNKDPGNEHYYQRLGMMYLQLERFHEARDIFRTSLKFGDQVASRHAHLAMAEFALGHRLTAIRYIKRAIALAPNMKKYQELLTTFEDDRG